MERNEGHKTNHYQMIDPSAGGGATLPPGESKAMSNGSKSQSLALTPSWRSAFIACCFAVILMLMLGKISLETAKTAVELLTLIKALL